LKHPLRLRLHRKLVHDIRHRFSPCWIVVYASFSQAPLHLSIRSIAISSARNQRPYALRYSSRVS
jgi:hypothetical protein